MTTVDPRLDPDLDDDPGASAPEPSLVARIYRDAAGAFERADPMLHEDVEGAADPHEEVPADQPGLHLPEGDPEAPRSGRVDPAGATRGSRPA